MNFKMNTITFLDNHGLMRYKESLFDEGLEKQRILEVGIDASKIDDGEDLILSVLNSLNCSSFGTNWDSFFSEMRSLDWLDEDYILIIFYNMEAALGKNTKLWNQFFADFLHIIFPDLLLEYNCCDQSQIEEDYELKCLKIICVSSEV